MQGRLEQDHQEARHDAADEHVGAEAREQQADGERDADGGEDGRERRAAEEAALEGDREQGQLDERHGHEQQPGRRSPASATTVRDLRLPGEQQDGRDDTRRR